jgi:hypothetical protein
MIIPNNNSYLDNDYDLSLYDVFCIHILEILPFYIFFELAYLALTKYNIINNFNTSYFIFHFIVNMINTILLIPYVITMFDDPLGKYIDPFEWNNLDYIYPMVIGLHIFHIVHNINRINYDEIIHHVFTHVFWYVTYTQNHPIYIVGMIAMSGIPGGITYLLLVLQKFNKITQNYEKKISMYLNIWLRAPLCVMFATLMYIKLTQTNYYCYYLTMFKIFFTIVNGIHFMHNIIYSYYSKKYN